MIDIYRELGEYGIHPVVVDPAADAQEAERLYGITFETMDAVTNMDAVLVAVAHKEFLPLTEDEIRGFYNPVHQRRCLWISRACLTAGSI